jgi:Zn-dependent protease with chaperone function
MRTACSFAMKCLLLAAILSAAGHAARAAQDISFNTALPADLPKAVLPSHPPAIQSINGETYDTFDANAATEAYLAKIPAQKRAASDAYFEGGYWLQLWDFLIGSAIFILLLSTGLSSGMRSFAERLVRYKPLQSMIYGVQFIILTSVLTLPMTIYEGYFREHKYGLLNQSFGPWFKEQLIGFAISLVMAPLLIAVLMGIVRKLGRSWWVWAAGVGVVFTLIVQLIAPVFIFPLFNTYKKLEDRNVRDTILSLARANGIPATDVYEVDASRQSNRVSANVSGFLGTQRITLNDNLLKRCSLAEIEMVMGHEMGHYALNHGYKMALFLIVMLVIMFGLLNWSLNKSLARWGEAWHIRGVTDVAVVPLAVLLFSIFGFLTKPIGTSAVRTQEIEADRFGLNASQQPDGAAEVDLKVGEYRKMSPGKWEEIIFFDHPSGRNRIATAMQWKKEHLPGSPLVAAGPTNAAPMPAPLAPASSAPAK